MIASAVIFDMDGLLIDSEPFWAEAEKTVFSALGVELSEALCRQTASMTTREVTAFWYRRFPWTGRSLEAVENDVIDCVDALIRQHGAPLPGVPEVVDHFHSRNCRVGLSTNAPHRLIATVLDTLDIAPFFHETSSSEHVERGKPDPAVYLSTLQKLGVAPAQCLAFEDSVSGMRAARAAGLRTVVVPPAHDFDNPEYALADGKWRSLLEFSQQSLHAEESGSCSW